ncbi:hypothetical protein ABBQ38_009005 [Trebouxia sp. C0009 RCD-2024]
MIKVGSVAQAASTAEAPQHVVICGAGIIGSAIAYYLAMKGVAATVVERASVACASSGKAGGFLALDWQDGGATGPLGRLSFKLHQELADTLGKDIGYRRVQTLSAAAAAAKQGVMHANTRGSQPNRRAGAPAWLDGSVSRIKAMGDESNTAQVHPQKLSQALMEAAQGKGAQLRIGEVQNITTSGKKVTGVIVDGEELAADAVVIAMGPWSGQAAKWLPVPDITGQKYASIVLRPQEEISNHMLFLSYKTSSGQALEPEVYPRPDGSVYICGSPEHIALPDDPKTIQVDPKSVEDLKEVARSVSSKLADAPLEVGQSCFLPLSPDGLPVMGKVPGVQGAYIASGHSCWGILNGPATGLVMAELIADGKASSVDIRKLDPQRLA